MKAKYLLVIALGVWSSIASFWVITPAITAIREPAFSDVASVLLILGVLLGLGGSCVALDGIKHLKRAA